jgi:hypothetical protein
LEIFWETAASLGDTVEGHLLLPIVLINRHRLKFMRLSKNKIRTTLYFRGYEFICIRQSHWGLIEFWVTLSNRSHQTSYFFLTNNNWVWLNFFFLKHTLLCWEAKVKSILKLFFFFFFFFFFPWNPTLEQPWDKQKSGFQLARLFSFIYWGHSEGTITNIFFFSKSTKLKIIIKEIKKYI